MLYNLVHLGLLRIQGPDAKKFLQGQLTCDLESVPPGQACLGAHCNPQGRLISLFHLFLFQETYYLLMQKSMLPIALAALKKYSVFFKATLDILEDGLHPIGVKYPDQSSFPSAVVHIALSPDQERAIVVSKHLPEATWYTPEQWQQENIDALLPDIYPETSGKFLPHDIQLVEHHGVSFDKGCFTGQEIIARMQYRGKLKSRLVKHTLQADTSPQRGEDVYLAAHARAYGTLIDFCTSASTSYDALIVTNETQNLSEPLIIQRK